MNNDRHSNDLRDLKSRNRRLSLAAAALIASQLMSSAIIISILGSEKTIVTPPSITKSFWVTKDRASSEYLEQMGAFVGWLILDVSPASIDWKKETLLHFVSPSKHGALKTKQELEAERLKKMNASTYFLPAQLVPSEEAQNVVLVGTLRTLVNGQETANEQKSYLVEFAHTGGRVHLNAFKEIPYGTQAPAQAAARAGGAPAQ